MVSRMPRNRSAMLKVRGCCDQAIYPSTAMSATCAMANRATILAHWSPRSGTCVKSCGSGSTSITDTVQRSSKSARWEKYTLNYLKILLVLFIWKVMVPLANLGQQEKTLNLVKYWTRNRPIKKAKRNLKAKKVTNVKRRPCPPKVWAPKKTKRYRLAVQIYVNVVANARARTRRLSVKRFAQYRAYRKKCSHRNYLHAKQYLPTLLESLREENNYMPRYGAVGLGGLAGVVWGLRGGIIRKVVYAGVGAGAVASVCYPREASEYTREGLGFMKKYVQIGYNFIYGVKPDYIRLPEPASFMRDPEGADVSKSSSRVLDRSSIATPALVSKGGAEEEKPPLEKMSTNRDQSREEDKELYSTRSK